MTIIENAKKFDPDREILLSVTQANLVLNNVRQTYPFKSSPNSIEALTSKKLYHPPSKPDYFFYWVEHGLKELGKISVASAATWTNAGKKIDIFKQLLHDAMNPDLTLAEKIDLNWADIPNFGGERLVAKKIISMYHDNILPIFKTDHLEGIYDKLIGNDKLPRGYRKLTLGEKFQLLSDGILHVKNSHKITKPWSPVYFMRFLYEHYPPWREERIQEPIPVDRLRPFGLLNVPSNEQEVVFLFAQLYQKLGIGSITKVQTKYPDVQAMDKKGNVLKIELELLASNFLDHDHDPTKCEWVVCWEDDLGDGWPFPSIEVKQLRDYIP
ncbi:MAG: hypothetical protein RTV72_09720 [Candidatus Thorarchaeota archaeon]